MANTVKSCQHMHEGRIHKPLLDPIMSNLKRQQKHALSIFKTCTFVFLATSNKREIADKQNRWCK